MLEIMSKELTIIDKDYIRWVEDLSVRYRQSQIRAAVRVNRELLKYYWELGRDIEEMRVEGGIQEIRPGKYYILQ